MANRIGYVKKSKLNTKKKKQNKFNISYSKLLWLIYPLLLIFFIQTLSFGSVVPGLIFPFTSFLNFVCTFILVVLIGGILYILLENKWVSLNILNIILIIIALGNRITISNTGNGFALSNLGVFNELNLLASTPGSRYLKFFLLAILFMIILNLLIYFMYSWKLGLKYKFPLVIIGIVIFLIFAQLITPRITKAKNESYDVDKNGVIVFFNNGIFQNNFIQYPSQKQVLEIKDDLVIEESNTEIDPNFIFVQIPNFIDITKVVELETDPLGNYHSIFNNGINFYTDISINGDNCLNLEFEALTGLPDDWYPYEVQVRGDNLHEDTISLASILKENGYYTANILPLDGEEGKRKEFYEKLNFDKSLLLEDLVEGTPEVVLGEIKNILEDDIEDPIFINTSLNVLKEEYLDGTTDGYIADLDVLDNYIGELKDIISVKTTPTVLVFYSGKLPDIAAINNGESSLDGIKKANTGYGLIWNNYNNSSNLSNDETIDLSQLPSMALSYMGASMPDYFHYFSELKNEDLIEAYNKDYLMENGILYSSSTEIYKEYTEEINVVEKDILGPNKFFEKSKDIWLPSGDE